MRTILTALFLCGSLAGPALAADAPEGGALDGLYSVFQSRPSAITWLSAARRPAAGPQGSETGLREFALEATGPLSDPVLRLAVAARSGGRSLAVYVRDRPPTPSAARSTAAAASPAWS